MPRGDPRIMVFSQTVEYALRTVAFLAADPDGTSTTPQIAEATLVPIAYLSKVIQALRRAGLVKCIRGVGGGVVLQRALQQLSVLDVIKAVEPFQRIHRCPLGLPEHRRKLCPLHASLDEAIAEIERRLGQTTLADLTQQGGLALQKTSPDLPCPDLDRQEVTSLLPSSSRVQRGRKKNVKAPRRRPAAPTKSRPKGGSST